MDDQKHRFKEIPLMTPNHVLADEQVREICHGSLGDFNRLFEAVKNPEIAERDICLAELESKLDLLSQYPRSQRCFSEAFDQGMEFLERYGGQERQRLFGLLGSKRMYINLGRLAKSGAWEIIYQRKPLIVAKVEILTVNHLGKKSKNQVLLARADGKPREFTDYVNKVNMRYR